MQNNPRKQDIIQELRGKRQDVTELCTEAEAVNEPHTGSGIVTDCLYLNVRKLPDINADVAVVIDALAQRRSIEMTRRKRLLSRTADQEGGAKA